MEDLARVVRDLPAPPVLIAHSMGGLVAQKYLEAHPLPAAVLLASVPPQGALGATLRYARRHPIPFLKGNLSLSLYPLVGSPALAREAFFATGMPDDALARHFPRIQDESYLAFLDMIVFSLPRPGRVRTLVLVLGAADDMIFTPAEVERTGQAYGTRAELFPGMGHDMMVEADWQAVADRILTWLRQRNL